MMFIKAIKRGQSFFLSKRVQTIGLGILLTISCLLGTFAWKELGLHKLNVFSGGDGKTAGASVVLQKYEKNIEGEMTTIPVAGAEFNLFRKSNDDNEDELIGETYITDQKGKIIVEGLILGDYYFRELPPLYPFYYDQDEEGNFIVDYHFTILEKSKTEYLEVYNRRLSQDLMLSKIVKNSDESALTQEQKSKNFKFTFSFENISAQDPQTYQYEIYNNEDPLNPIKAGTVGLAGEIDLQHNQTAVFKNLPGRTGYLFTEKSTEGYRITSTDHQGNLQINRNAHAKFINTFQMLDPNIGHLNVFNEIIYSDVNNPPNYNTEFVFRIQFSDGKQYPYTVGDSEELFNLGSNGEFRLKHDEKAAFKNLPSGINYIIYSEKQDDFIQGKIMEEGTIVQNKIQNSYFFHFYGDSDIEETNLLVGKEIVSDVIDNNRVFNFKLALQGDNLPNEILFEVGGKEEILSASGEFSLKHGQVAIFKNLPIETHYIVEEIIPIEEMEYIPAIKKFEGNIIPVHDANHHQFINIKQLHIPNTYNLTVQKLLQHVDEEDQTQFDFEIKIGEGNDAKFETFSLKGGEEKVFELPAGEVYLVREIIDDNNLYELILVDNGYGHLYQDTIARFTNGLPELKSIEVQKKWELEGSLADISAQKVTIFLMQKTENEKYVQVSTVELTQEKNWKDIFKVRKYDALGNEIEYKVLEQPIRNFESEIKQIDSNNLDPNYVLFEITNTYIKPISYNPLVKKNVVGNPSDSIANFVFRLAAIDEAPMPKDGSNEISIKGSGEIEFSAIEFVREGTYRYNLWEEKGQDIGYTYDDTQYTLIIEVAKKENALTIEKVFYKSDTSSIEDKAIFTNHYSNPNVKNITVQKSWTGGINKNQPSSVKVQLYQNGKAYGAPITLNDRNAWKYTWNQLDAKFEWTVDEVSVPDHYEKHLYRNGDKFLIENRLIGSNTISIQGMKTWIHGLLKEEHHPKEITVILKANGNQIEQKKVTQKDQWKFYFDQLSELDNKGNPIKYSVEELSVPIGYTASIQGYNITNTHKSYQSKEIPVKKIWDDAGNKNFRPKQIIVHVKKGNAIMASKIITEEQGWEISFSLPKIDKDGKEIEYYLEEKAVPYYKTTISGYEITNTLILKPPLTQDSAKIWLWIMIVAVVIGSGILVLLVRRKIRQ